MVRLVIPLLAAAALLACGHATVKPSPLLAEQPEILVTGVGIIDATGQYPIRPEQIYPQVRVRALEMAVRNAQGEMMKELAGALVTPDVTLGDMMEAHPNLRLVTQDFVNGLPLDEPRWDWEGGMVEVDLRVLPGELEHFVTSLPASYLPKERPAEAPVATASATTAETMAPAEEMPAEEPNKAPSEPNLPPMPVTSPAPGGNAGGI